VCVQKRHVSCVWLYACVRYICTSTNLFLSKSVCVTVMFLFMSPMVCCFYARLPFCLRVMDLMKLHNILRDEVYPSVSYLVRCLNVFLSDRRKSCVICIHQVSHC